MFNIAFIAYFIFPYHTYPIDFKIVIETLKNLINDLCGLLVNTVRAFFVLSHLALIRAIIMFNMAFIAYFIFLIMLLFQNC